MPQENAAYDLMLLIDPEAPDDRRAQLIDSIKRQVESGGGSLRGDVDWGRRALAYEIDHHSEAHYHLFQLEAVSELLNQLDRMLAIEDAVLRHRIIRLPRGTPDNPPPPPPASRRSHPPADASEEHSQQGREDLPSGAGNSSSSAEQDSPPPG